MMAKTTLSLCLAGAIGSVLIGFMGIGWSLISVEDGLIFPLVIGPYVIIASLAWWRRTSPWESWMLLATVAIVMPYGFWAFGLACYHRFSATHDEIAMDISPLVASVLQFLLTFAVSVVIGVASIIRSKKEP